MPKIKFGKDQAARLREIAQTGNGRESDRPVILTITSGKGGVGKSTLALNLALKMADQGKQILLFDADANLANLDVMLGVSPDFRLGHVLRGEIAIEEALVSPHPRIKFLAGSSGDIQYPQIDISIQEYILEQLTGIDDPVDFIIVDTSAGLNREVVNYSLFADESIIVTNPEPTAIMDAYAMIKIISMSKPGHKFGIIINAAKSPHEADEAAEKLQMVVAHFLKLPVMYLGHVPYDANVRTAITGQSAVVQKYPRTRASLSIQKIARQLAFENYKVIERSAVSV